ncbi:MAG: hypothetical protein AB7O78_09880 [Thermoleophilia bacterium]
MPDQQHDDHLTDDEREFLRRTGYDPTRHAAIRDLPRGYGGGRSIEDISAALTAASQKKEDD